MLQGKTITRRVHGAEELAHGPTVDRGNLLGVSPINTLTDKSRLTR